MVGGREDISTRNGGIATLPIAFLFYFLNFFYRLASSVLPSSVIGPLAALVESESESEKLLRTMPSEQAALQQDVSQVERDQAVLGRDMDNLSARIRQLEERRIRRSRRARLLRRKIIDDDLG